MKLLQVKGRFSLGEEFKNIKRSIKLLTACVLIYLIIDYINPFGFFKINILRINTDFLSIILSNLVVVSIAVFTFAYIDKREINKHINQENVAKLLIKMTYENCKSNIEIFDDEHFVKKLIDKVDFDSLDTKNDPVRKIEKSAYENEHLIMEAFMEGTLPNDILEDYFAMKKAYGLFMTVRVIFFDHPEIYEREKRKFITCFENGMAHLEG